MQQDRSRSGRDSVVDFLAILEFDDTPITRHAKLPDLGSDLAGQTREGWNSVSGLDRTMRVLMMGASDFSIGFIARFARPCAREPSHLGSNIAARGLSAESLSGMSFRSSFAIVFGGDAISGSSRKAAEVDAVRSPGVVFWELTDFRDRGQVA